MTHKKIAELAHVSTSTVSKALSGNPEISFELAERIKKIAIECGYFKEKRKRRIKTPGKQPIIAVVCPEIISVFYSSIITKLKKEIEDRGGYIAVYIYDFDLDKMNRIIKTLTLKGDCDGIITFSPPEVSASQNMPIVCLCSNHSDNFKPFDFVGVNYKKVIFDAVEYFKKLGHTKIGIATELFTTSNVEYFKEALNYNGIKIYDEYIYISHERFDKAGSDIAVQIQKSGNPPTAVLAAYDEIAMSLIHELSKNGVSVPDDISIMGIDDIPYASYANLPLTTINLFPEEQHSIAVKILFNRIYNEDAPLQQVTIQHKIIERETTKIWRD